ncbi:MULTISPECIES: sialidase family protein [unclassified Helicobacter]|uniref:sialidase family protein n=1 Tax=unclassified Helicobacter TaxID=2593540 RepID=UPI000CF0EE38|nr:MULTISPECIES: sialidase family protein [unclassified Helicobacter]
MRHFFTFLFALVLLGSIAYYNLSKHQEFEFVTPSATATNSPISVYKQEDIPMPKGVQSAHSSTITFIDKNHLLSAYFAGSREGAKDVAIYGNIYTNYQWSDAFVILTPKQLMEDSKEYISKLGNPVLYNLDDTLHLFVVGVSIGGWATSKIYHYTSKNNPRSIHFTFQKALHLSPFLNLSNLVRTAPIEIIFNTKQKGVVLPIYHELANKYPLLAVLDSKGKILEISKPNNAYGLLQPSITTLDSTHCLLAFRAHKKANSILYTQECDTQLHYKPLIKTNLVNEDNSLALFTLNHQTYLLHNSRNENLTRGKLTLSELTSLDYFEKLLDIDSTSTKDGEVSYPFILLNGDLLHLTYTVDRKFIRHLYFNATYLDNLTKREKYK